MCVRFAAVRGALVPVVSLLLLHTAAAEDYEPGDQVVVIADAKLSVKGNAEVDEVWLGLVLKVAAVNGKWLWVSNGKPGWLDQSHVIPLDRRAIDRLTAMIRAEPRNAGLYQGRAFVWQALGEIDIAMGDVNEAIRLSPSAACYNSRGNAWQAKAEYDKAIADYNEALRLDPKDAMAYNNRGNAWGDKGEYDKAIDDYNEAIRLDPKDATAYNNRGVAWKAKNEYGKAIDDYNEALRLDPKYATAYNNRAWVWDAKGEYDKAIDDYSEALRLDPKDPDSNNGLAWLRATCPDAEYRDGKQAVADATRACELTRWKDANNLDTLAASYAEAGEFDKAVEWQTKARDLAPENQKADYQTRVDLYRAGKQHREE